MNNEEVLYLVSFVRKDAQSCLQPAAGETIVIGVLRLDQDLRQSSHPYIALRDEANKKAAQVCA